MKIKIIRIFILLFFLTISFSVKGQLEGPLIKMKLKQVEFINPTLEKMLTNVVHTNKEMFGKGKNDLYVILFFQSPIYSDKYFITLDYLWEKITSKMYYYLTIDEIKFLIAKDFPENSFKIINHEKLFVWQEKYYIRENIFFYMYYSDKICYILKESINE